MNQLTRDEIFETTLENFLEPVRAYRLDPSVSEIMINGPNEIYIERQGKISKTTARFDDPETLEALARNLAQFVNQRISGHTSRFDSRLPDGSRVHVVMPRTSRTGMSIAIRQFSTAAMTLAGLVENRTLTPEVLEYLRLAVELRLNLLVAGGTGTGKTSFLNALSKCIPDSTRILVIEDISELKLQQPHVLRFEAVAPDKKGRGAVSVRDLFHSALRMRPDRIVIGECRGGEALDLIQAMTSGHEGSMSTLHASKTADALRRLETMALMSGVEIPLVPLRQQIASAIHIVVQLDRVNGRRVVSEIAEVNDTLDSSQNYKMQNIFELKRIEGSAHSLLQFTGQRSGLAGALSEQGMENQVKLTKSVFGI
jgi:pilus assembly protein CpaF